jgi:hypothetical protein
MTAEQEFVVPIERILGYRNTDISQPLITSGIELVGKLSTVRSYLMGDVFLLGRYGFELALRSNFGDEVNFYAYYVTFDRRRVFGRDIDIVLDDRVALDLINLVNDEIATSIEIRYINSGEVKHVKFDYDILNTGDQDELITRDILRLRTNILSIIIEYPAIQLPGVFGG